jgi:predicted GTPase
LIWRVAGGAETDKEYCSDEEHLVPVDTAALKRRFKVQDSAETLNIANLYSYSEFTILVHKEFHSLVETRCL